MIVWILAVFFWGNQIYTRCSNKSTFSQVKTCFMDNNIKTLNIKIPEYYKKYNYAPNCMTNGVLAFNINDSKAIYVCPNVRVLRVDSAADCCIKINKSAYGESSKEAEARARMMPNGFTQTDSNTITIEPLRFDREKPWSFEHINISLYVTDSISVNFDNKIRY